MKHVKLNPSTSIPPTKPQYHESVPSTLPDAKETKIQPSTTSSSTSANDFLFFVGTATTILEYAGLRILKDPNFLHAGDHVHLGPVLLSHYHEDHFDKEVEQKLPRELPIITTPHAHGCLTGKGEESFVNVHALNTWEGLVVDVEGSGEGGKKASIKVTAMPGKHVPPGPLNVANDILGAVPPTNGWMVELGTSTSDENFMNGYRIYISGDTLMVDELKLIPERYRDQNIDLMLVHLGGTTIPGPKFPLLMVTMDAVQGVQLMRLVNPDITIPIHYDDYDVFLTPLEEFKKKVQEEELADKVVYLDRGDQFKFDVRRA